MKGETRLGNYDRIAWELGEGEGTPEPSLTAASQGYWQTKCNLLDQTTNNKQDNQGHWKPEEATKKKIQTESESSDSLP
jgi:hypothetical protein